MRKAYSDITELLKEIEKTVACLENKELKAVAFGKLLGFAIQNANFKEYTPKPLPIHKRFSARTQTREPNTKTEKKDGPKAWVEELIDENFFKTPKNINDVLRILEERGHHLKDSDLSLPFTKFVRDEKKLRRKRQVGTEGTRKIWHYTNW